MISGHRTEKLLSLGFEILGLEVGVNYSEKKKQWHKKINKAQKWQWKICLKNLSCNHSWYLESSVVIK